MFFIDCMYLKVSKKDTILCKTNVSLQNKTDKYKSLVQGIQSEYESKKVRLSY